MVVIREERPEDIEAVRRLNEEAFGQPAEDRIVDSLRENCADILSLEGTGLAPMAVLPQW